jgi:SAM-dependent methyltransferase
MFRTRTLDHCLACGGRDLTRLPMRYEYRDISIPVAQCRTCGMRFLQIQPEGESLASMYGAEYFEQDYRCGRSEAHSFDEAAFHDEHRGLVDEFERLRPAGRLFEVGSAAGGLLRHAADRGWAVRGVELSQVAVDRARGLGLDVTQGDLLSARLADAAVDLVYMGDVLEHVPDCRAVLAEVARVLAPGGYLYLRGPITTNSLARRLGLALYGMLGREIVLREPPYHLWEFTPRSLTRLARACGLEVVELRQGKIPPGRPHGDKSAAQRAAMVALDAMNVPLTRWFNVLGDRGVLIARRPAT